MKNPPESYITPADIQERLKVARSTAYAIARQCGFYKLGRAVRISESAFQAWLRQREQAAESSPRLAPVARVEPFAYKSMAQRRKEARRAAQRDALGEPPATRIKLTRPRT